MKQKIERMIRLGERVISCGFVNLVRDSRGARDYWRRIVNAAVYPPENDSCKLLGLPSYRIEQVIDGFESIPVSLTDYQYSYGDMPLNEIVILCRIARYMEPRIIFEIGTYKGGTTVQLACNSKAAIYTLDLPGEDHEEYVQSRLWDPESDVYPDQPGVRFHRTQYEQRISQLLGNSQTFDFSPYYGMVDLILVDGCHHYNFVLSDSQNALKMMSSRGIVVWHDYAPYSGGVLRCLNELGKGVPLAHIQGTSLVITGDKDKGLS